MDPTISLVTEVEVATKVAMMAREKMEERGLIDHR